MELLGGQLHRFFATPSVVLCKPDDIDIVIGSRQNFFKRSINGGETWIDVTPLSIITNLTPLRLSASPVNTSNMFLGRKYDASTKSVWRSLYSGSSWEPCNNFTWATDVYDVAPYPVPGVGRNDELWVCGSHPTGQQAFPKSTTSLSNERGIWYSNNAGLNWQAKPMGGHNLRSLVVIHQTNNPYLITVTENGEIFRSTNYGVDWYSVYSTNSVPTLMRVNRNTSPNTVFLACNGGIYRSTNEGGNWSQVNNGLGTDIDVLSLAIQPLSNTIIIGTANSTYKSTNNGDTWVNVGGMNVTSVNGSGNTTWSVTKDNAYVGRTTNNGTNWVNNFILSAGSNFNSQHLYHHLTNGLFASGAKDNKASLCRSTDLGINFNEVFNLPSGGSRFNGTIVHPNNTSVMYLFGGGASDGNWNNIFSSSNNGLNWVVNGNVGGTSNIFINDLSTSFNLADGLILFAVLSDGKIFRHINANWSEILNFGTSTRSGVASFKNIPNLVYAWSDNAIKRSINTGSSWTDFVLSGPVRRVRIVPVSSTTSHIFILPIAHPSYDDEIHLYSDYGTTYGYDWLGYANLGLPNRIDDLFNSSSDPTILYAIADNKIFKIDLPYQPSLTEPGNNATVYGTSATLRWNSVAGASVYQLQVDNNSDFSSPEYNISDINGIQYTVSNLGYWNIYYWRVKAKNSYYNKTSEWSSVRTFSTAQSGGGGGGCPFVYTWNGNEFVEDNNILPQSEYIPKEDGFVTDHYQLFTTPAITENAYRLRVGEFEQERSYLDKFSLIVIDHEPEASVSVSEDGAISQYAKPSVIANAQLDKDDVFKLIYELDGNYVQAERGTTLQLTFDGPQTKVEKEETQAAALVGIIEPGEEKKFIVGSVNQNIDGKFINTHQFRLRRNPSFVWIPVVRQLTDSGSKDGTVQVDINWQQSVRVDYTELSNRLDLPYTTYVCDLTLAEHSHYGNVTDLLLDADNSTAVLNPCSYVDLAFDAPPLAEGKKRSFIFVSHGRYERISEKLSESVLIDKKAKTNSSEDNPNKPTRYELSQNHPNPFNPVTQISYALPEAGYVTLKVYDVLGREVATLVDENKEVGYYNATFNASSLSSGVYFYKFVSGNYTAVKKLLITK